MASSDSLSSKHQKFEIKDADLLNDALPEDVISRILSLLPTKEAVKTSILSKRWRFLWTTISNLDFCDYNETDLGPRNLYGEYRNAKTRSTENRKRFIRHVSSVLRPVDPMISIDKLSITLRMYPKVVEMKKWVSFAGKRNVKDLTLRVRLLTRIIHRAEVPLTVFDCKSLESLTLSDNLRLKIPKQRLVCFPNLKFLTLYNTVICGIPAEENFPCFPKMKNLCLHYVQYEGNDDDVMKLIRNCPLLEDLSISRNVDPRVSDVDMCIPQLSTVSLFGTWLREVDVLKIQIKTLIKSLTVLGWNRTNKIVVENIDSLVEAKIGFYNPLQIDDLGEEELLQLFKMVDKVKCLGLCIHTLTADKIGQIKLPLFNNLIRLEVVLFCKQLRRLEGYLNIAINLEILVIDKCGRCRFREDRCIEEDERWTKLSNVPKCMISSLKRVEISFAANCSGELDMIKIILQSAKVLENLTTKTSCFYKRSNLDYRCRIISQLQRASALCQFDILESPDDKINLKNRWYWR